MPNFSIGLEALDEETQDQEVEVVYSLQSSMMNIQPCDILDDAQEFPIDAVDWETYDPLKLCQPCLGDAWAKIAEEVLFIEQPLPGDSPWIVKDPL